MATTATQPTSLRPSRTTTPNPYVQLGMRVMDSALKMEQDAKVVSQFMTLRSTKPLTKSEQRRLDSLYIRMDRHEVILKKHLNP